MPKLVTPDLKATIAAAPVKRHGVAKRNVLPNAVTLPKAPSIVVQLSRQKSKFFIMN